MKTTNLVNILDFDVKITSQSCYVCQNLFRDVKITCKSFYMCQILSKCQTNKSILDFDVKFTSESCVVCQNLFRYLKLSKYEMKTLVC